MRYFIVKYHWIQSDHIFAVPKFHHEEKIAAMSTKELDRYITSQVDEYDSHYVKKKILDFDYTSDQGAVKVEELNLGAFKIV